MNDVVKSRVSVAVDRKRKFDMSKQHLTTGNFMEFSPSYCQMVVPNSHIKINHKTFFRCLPLDKPTLGSISVHNRAFFVPFSFVWEPFKEFLTDVPSITLEDSHILNSTPYFTCSDVIDAITNNRYGFVESSTAGSYYDFQVVNGTEYIGYLLTPKGKRFVKFLTSLGYPFTTRQEAVTIPVFSALPLLAAVKVYMDYYYPSAYSNYGEYATIQGFFKRNWNHHLTGLELAAIGNVVSYVAYSNDFFSGVWDNPVSPNEGVYSEYNIPDISFGSPVRNSNSSSASSNTHYIWPSSIVTGDNGTPLMFGYTGTGTVPNSLPSTLIPSQYALDSLKSLTNYMKRHQLVGSRVVDRFLASYGVGLSNAELRRSYYLGDYTFPVDIGDVTSHADTSSASLGSYAGKAVGYSGDSNYFECDADDFGMVFVITTIIPDVAYVKGVDPVVKLVSRLDFLNGEFDGLGPQAVTADLLDPSLFDNIELASNQIFGYAPRYFSHKVPFDKMTGGFTFNTSKYTFQGWSTVRMFDLSMFGNNVDNVKHSIDFVLGKDASQYNRIFLGGTDKTTEPFIMVHRDDVDYFAPMKPVYDSYDFDEDDKQDITFKPNGVKMN